MGLDMDMDIAITRCMFSREPSNNGEASGVVGIRGELRGKPSGDIPGLAVGGRVGDMGRKEPMDGSDDVQVVLRVTAGRVTAGRVTAGVIKAGPESLPPPSP